MGCARSDDCDRWNWLTPSVSRYRGEPGRGGLARPPRPALDPPPASGEIASRRRSPATVTTGPGVACRPLAVRRGEHTDHGRHRLPSHGVCPATRALDD